MSTPPVFRGIPLKNTNEEVRLLQTGVCTSFSKAVNVFKKHDFTAGELKRLILMELNRGQVRIPVFQMFLARLQKKQKQKARVALADFREKSTKPADDDGLNAMLERAFDAPLRVTMGEYCKAQNVMIPGSSDGIICMLGEEKFSVSEIQMLLLAESGKTSPRRIVEIKLLPKLFKLERELLYRRIDTHYAYSRREIG